MLRNTTCDAVITNVERACLAKCVRRTIAKIAKRKFREDPLVVSDLSLTASEVSSAYKRHGFVLEVALRTALDTRADLKAWTAKLLVPPRTKQVQVDLLTYQPASQTLTAYEVKRGFDNQDDQARDGLEKRLTDLLAFLPKYANSKNLSAAVYKVAVVGYYDEMNGSIGPHKLIARPDLIAEFGQATMDFLEDVNDYFSHCLLRRQARHLLGGLQQMAELPHFREAISPAALLAAETFPGLETSRHPWDALGD
jgi:hypothetical protein